MKKKIVLMVLVGNFLILGLTPQVFAYNPEPTMVSRKIQDRDRLNYPHDEEGQVMEARQEVRQEVRETVRQQVSQKMSDNAKRVTQRIEERLKRRYQRLLEFKARIEERVRFRESQGEDMGQVRNTLAGAESQMARFGSEMQNLEDLNQEMLSAEAPRGVLAQVRTQLREVNKVLGETRLSLVQALRVMIGIE